MNKNIKNIHGLDDKKEGNMIILITGYFDICDVNGIPTGKKKFVVSHGVDSETFKHICLPCIPPLELGGVYDHKLDEWVILNK